MLKYEIDKLLGYEFGQDISKDFQPVPLNYTALVPLICNGVLQVKNSK